MDLYKLHNIARRTIKVSPKETLYSKKYSAQYLNSLSEKYEMTFPKGASHVVDEFAQKFVDRYGFEELNHVAKIHFKNTQNIKK